MKTKKIAQLKNVTKKYTLRHEKPTLSDLFFLKTHQEPFVAIDNMSMEIKSGEKLGVIGENGSGKTTLLKLLTGITSPTTGSVSVQGRVVSVIDAEAGFHPDLPGMQNIFLNGTLLGMSRNEIQSKLHEIIAFSGIGKFIDVPLFTYSTGMKLRLGFSIAAHSDPDLLIIDEAIAVGDNKFQKKIKRMIKQFFKKGKAVVIASHWLDFIKDNCDRVIVVHEGKIWDDGGPELIDVYKKFA